MSNKPHAIDLVAQLVGMDVEQHDEDSFSFGALTGETKDDLLEQLESVIEDGKFQRRAKSV